MLGMIERFAAFTYNLIKSSEERTIVAFGMCKVETIRMFVFSAAALF